MQREISILSAVERPKPADAYLVNAATDLCHAVRLAIQIARLSDTTVCETLGIDKGHFSRMMKGKANLPLNKLPDLMVQCGTLLPVQVMAKQMGLQVYEDPTAKRRAELEAELARLREVA